MAVGPQDHEVLELTAAEFDAAVDQILELHRPIRNTKPDRARAALALSDCDVVLAERAASAIVPPRGAARFEPLAFGLELVRRAVTVVRIALRDEPVRHCPIAIDALGLKVRCVRPAD